MMNTLRYARELEATGLNKDQAEKVVTVVYDVMNGHFSTKQDLLELRSDIFLRLNEIENRTALKFAEVDKKFEQRFVEVDKKFFDMDKKFEQRFVEMDKKFAAIDKRFDLLESSLTIKMGMLQAASITIIVGLMKLL